MIAFRLNASFRFNVNFFKIMMNPQFRLLGVLEMEATTTEKIRMMEIYRKRFKAFMCFPKSVPNEMIQEMIGDFNEIAERLRNSVRLQE